MTGCKLYFERKTDLPPCESPAYLFFVNSKNSVSIRVNKPPSENFDFPLNVDSRWKIEKLREIIGKEIDISPLNLRMFKG